MKTTSRVVVGAALVAVGIAWLLDTADVLDVPPRTILPAALIVVGVLLVATSREGAHAGLVVTGAVLAAALAISTAVAPGDGSFQAFGDRVERPSAVADLADYGAAFGRLTVDLTGLSFPAGTTKVSAGVAFGSLSILVPPDVRVTGTVDVTFGDASVFGRRFEGIGSDGRFSDGSSIRVVELELSAAFGEVVVRRSTTDPSLRYG